MRKTANATEKRADTKEANRRILSPLTLSDSHAQVAQETLMLSTGVTE